MRVCVCVRLANGDRNTHGSGGTKKAARKKNENDDDGTTGENKRPMITLTKQHGARNGQKRCGKTSNVEDEEAFSRKEKCVHCMDMVIEFCPPIPTSSSSSISAVVVAVEFDSFFALDEKNLSYMNVVSLLIFRLRSARPPSPVYTLTHVHPLSTEHIFFAYFFSRSLLFFIFAELWIVIAIRIYSKREHVYASKWTSEWTSIREKYNFQFLRIHTHTHDEEKSLEGRVPRSFSQGNGIIFFSCNRECPLTRSPFTSTHAHTYTCADCRLRDVFNKMPLFSNTFFFLSFVRRFWSSCMPYCCRQAPISAVPLPSATLYDYYCYFMFFCRCRVEHSEYECDKNVFSPFAFIYIVYRNRIARSSTMAGDKLRHSRVNALSLARVLLWEWRNGILGLRLPSPLLPSSSASVSASPSTKHPFIRTFAFILNINWHLCRHRFTIHTVF